MKLQFAAYARRPLGRLLGSTLGRIERFPPTTPIALSLASRHGRKDLSRDELVRAAAASPFDTCHIETTAGEIMVVWRYGPGKSVPMMFGTIEVSPEELNGLESVLVDLCIGASCSYGVCDLETARYALEDGTDPYLAQGTPLDLFWWNYFGPEYRTTLVIDEVLRGNAVRAEALPNDAIVVVTRNGPATRVDMQKVQAIAARWPVFLRWNPTVEVKVRVDYSEIRSLPAAASPIKRRVADFVGPADEFIASVLANERRFIEWAGTKGFQPKTEDDFRRFFRENYAVIRDEYLVSAAAAYGEAVRRTLKGEWTKARLFGRGEPVVGRPGRPWSRRRVIYEVLDALQEDVES